MPRIEVVVAGVTRKQALRFVRHAAEDGRLRVEVPEFGNADLRVRAGDLALAIFLGAFILYVDAAVTADPLDRGELAVTFDWTSPWWTGLIGVGRTRSAIKRVADILEDDVHDAGGEVLDRIGG